MRTAITGEVFPVLDIELDLGDTIIAEPGVLGRAFACGNGMWLARLTGPGRVWLQTLTLPNLAHVLSPYIGNESS